MKFQYFRVPKLWGETDSCAKKPYSNLHTLGFRSRKPKGTHTTPSTNQLLCTKTQISCNLGCESIFLLFRLAIKCSISLVLFPLYFCLRVLACIPDDELSNLCYWSDSSSSFVFTQCFLIAHSLSIADIKWLPLILALGRSNLMK